MGFKITEKDIFAAKLAAKPIDIRKVKTEQEWLDTVRILEENGVLATTSQTNARRVQYPIIGIAQKTEHERRGRTVTLQIGQYVSVFPPKS